MNEEEKEKARQRTKLWYANNKEKATKYKWFYRTEKIPAYLLTKSKIRARRDNIKHSITKDDIVVPKFCPIILIPILPGVGKVCANSPSLDKIIPEEGYVKGNVQVISHKANAMKQNATPEELRAFAKWVLRTFPEEPNGTS